MAGAFGEAGGANPLEPLERGTKLDPRVGAVSAATLPFAVGELATGELERPGGGEPQRLVERRIGLCVVRERRATARGDGTHVLVQVEASFLVKRSERLSGVVAAADAQVGVD